MSGTEVTLYLPEKTLAKLEGAIKGDRDLMSTTQAVYHLVEAGMKLAELNPGAPLSSLSALTGRLQWTGTIDLRDQKECSVCRAAEIAELRVGNVRTPVSEGCDDLSDRRGVAIDLSDQRGCSEKTLDRYIKPWCVHGRSPDGKTVDVADIDQDVFTGVPPDIAEKLIQERQRHAGAIFDIVNGGWVY